MKRVFLAGADIDVSIRIGAVLGRPSSRIMPSSDLDDIVAKDHDMFLVETCVFFACRVVMFDGMKMRRGDALIFIPRTNVVSPVVFLDGSDGGGGIGNRRH